MIHFLTHHPILVAATVLVVAVFVVLALIERALLERRATG